MGDETKSDVDPSKYDGPALLARVRELEAERDELNARILELEAKNSEIRSLASEAVDFYVAMLPSISIDEANRRFVVHEDVLMSQNNGKVAATTIISAIAKTKGESK